MLFYSLVACVRAHNSSDGPKGPSETCEIRTIGGAYCFPPPYPSKTHRPTGGVVVGSARILGTATSGSALLRCPTRVLLSAVNNTYCIGPPTIIIMGSELGGNHSSLRCAPLLAKSFLPVSPSAVPFTETSFRGKSWHVHFSYLLCCDLTVIIW